MGNRIFYHATNSVIERPCSKYIAALGYNEDGSPIIGLFGNTDSIGIQQVYGANLYGFTLIDGAKVLSLSSKNYLMMRNSKGYRAGFFDAALRAGFSALVRTHIEGDTSIVVLNFKSIQGWQAA